MSFELKQTDWLQLTPLGLFPHARGFQQVDAIALAALVKNFNSFIARLGRRFAGIPFYIGHPDVSGYENIFPDRKAYGWIMELEAREDGLYGRPKWSKAGHELIENGHYKFLSPYWEAANVGSKDGKPLLRPTHLISVGLTNDPNIPVLPLANNTELGCMPLVGMSLRLATDSELDNEITSAQPNPPAPSGSSLPSRPSVQNSRSQIPDPKSASEPDHESRSESLQPGNQFVAALGAQIRDQKLTTEAVENRSTSAESSDFQTLNPERKAQNPALPPAALPSVQNSAYSAVQNSSVNSVSPPEIAELLQRISSLENSLTELRSSETELQARLSTLEISNHESKIANRELEVRLINTVLNHALADLRILPAERDYWLHQLESNFDAVSIALANAEPKLNRRSRAENLTLINTPTPVGKTRTDQILALVNERMRATGRPFHESWIETKKNHPSLFL